jgi:subtilisin family serine protease
MKPSPAPRELVLVAEADIGLSLTPEGLNSAADVSVDSLSQLLASEGASLEHLFGLSEELIDSRSVEISAMDVTTPALSRYYTVSAPEDRFEALAKRLRAHPAVYAAFIKPGVELPFMSSGTEWVPNGANGLTPDFVGRQFYLGGQPEGINAKAAWARNGGGGANIKIVDVEGAWRFTHEDLKENQGGVAGGTKSTKLRWRNHGTAVLGILSGDRNEQNNIGIIGICPDANVRGVSVFGQPASLQPSAVGSPAAIRQAADLLSAGDILLIELHLPGPQVEFQPNDEQRGYIPVEWWPDNLVAIQYAVAKGLIVVEAAGNGACDLDSNIFDQNPASPNGPFPATWKNPFRRTDVDSGAILVGAGAPRRLLNGKDWGPSLSRMEFSNFGSMVDAQGWGQDVTTSGFGNLQRGFDEDRWYTRDFGGTSSAAPMVAGALACVQGALKAANRPLLTPSRARQLLRETGTHQVDSAPADHRPATQRIGNRPDILQMMTSLGL